MAGAFAAQLAVCIANLRAMEDMSNNLTEARIEAHLPAWVDTGLICTRAGRHQTIYTDRTNYAYEGDRLLLYACICMLHALMHANAHMNMNMNMNMT